MPVSGIEGLVGLLPESFAGLLPIVVPFLIGLIVGLLIKTVLKLAIGVLALAVLLSWGGYAGFPSVKELFSRAQSHLPALFGKGKGLLNALSITAPAFVVGLLLGVWWK